MSAEVQESGKKGKGSKQKKMTVRVDFTPMVDMNIYVADYFFYAVYHVEQTSDDGNKYAEQ